MKNVSLFDFDGTITRKDTIKILIQELVRYRPFKIFHAFSLLIKIFLERDDHITQKNKNKLIGELLKGLSYEELEKPLNKFKQRVSRIIRPLIIEAFNESNRQNSVVLIVTASPDFSVKKALEDFDVSVIGTQFEKSDKKFTGKLAGLNCYDEEKINRINNWTLSYNINANFIECWGDSLSDLPMMKLAKNHNWIVNKKNMADIKELDPDANFHYLV